MSQRQSGGSAFRSSRWRRMPCGELSLRVTELVWRAENVVQLTGRPPPRFSIEPYEAHRVGRGGFVPFIDARNTSGRRRGTPRERGRCPPRPERSARPDSSDRSAKARFRGPRPCLQIRRRSCRGCARRNRPSMRPLPRRASRRLAADCRDDPGRLRLESKAWAGARPAALSGRSRSCRWRRRPTENVPNPGRRGLRMRWLNRGTPDR